MFLDRYEVEISRDNTIYEFISKGEKGEIKKVVRYSDTTLKASLILVLVTGMTNR